MRKAVFLDRDGVINKGSDEYIFRKEDFIINPGVADFIKFATSKGYMIIVITNQGGIAKGLYKVEDAVALHEYMCKLLSDENAYIDEVYFCPHHESTGKCICRKPDSLLIEKAISRFGIAASESVFFGDKERDTETAEKAGVKGIQIECNESLMNYKHELIEA